jgi:hypothetical protein
MKSNENGVARAFLAALLLTASVPQAERAVLDAIDALGLMTTLRKACFGTLSRR